MSRLDPFEVFAFYHLGYDRDFEYRFRNLHDAARYFETEPDRFQRFLGEQRMDPETIRHVDFNLAAHHADAQMLDLEGASLDERRVQAEQAYRAFRLALETTYDKSREFDDIDWDDPLGPSPDHGRGD